MTHEMFVALIKGILAAGCGAFIQFFYSQYLQARKLRDEDMSPFAKRWVIIFICATVPTLLYGLVVLITYDRHDPATWYDLVSNIGYCTVAFTVTQGIHGVGLPKVPVVAVPAQDVIKVNEGMSMDR